MCLRRVGNIARLCCDRAQPSNNSPPPSRLHRPSGIADIFVRFLQSRKAWPIRFSRYARFEREQTDARYQLPDLVSRETKPAKESLSIARGTARFGVARVAARDSRHHAAWSRAFQIRDAPRAIYARQR